MTGTSYRLTEDEVRFLRQMEERLAALERAQLAEVPVGALIDYGPPCRSPRWSDTRREAMGDRWSYWFDLNEFNSDGIVNDASRDPDKQGILEASVAESLPILGQPGGLTSDGGYSTYFSGLNGSRVLLPLTISKDSHWSMEVVFKPEIMPQKAALFHAGKSTENGFGAYIADAAGNSGFKLVFRKTGEGWIDTGIELKAGQWYHAIFIANESDGYLYWYVSTLEEPNKRFYILQGKSLLGSVITPEESSVIGSQTDGSSYDFKGWIDEVSTYADTLPGGEGQGSISDRLRTSLEPAAPFGFLLADGTAVSRSKYARLFRVLGTSEGSGDLASTFNLPQISPSRVLIKI